MEDNSETNPDSNKPIKDKNDGNVPISVLNHLNQFCEGGFILFFFNHKDGSPNRVMTFDSHAHALALQNYMNNFSTALKQLNIHNEKMSLIKSLEDEDDEI
jgi:hypothetical protein